MSRDMAKIRRDRARAQQQSKPAAPANAPKPPEPTAAELTRARQITEGEFERQSKAQHTPEASPGGPTKAAGDAPERIEATGTPSPAAAEAAPVGDGELERARRVTDGEFERQSQVHHAVGGGRSTVQAPDAGPEATGATGDSVGSEQEDVLREISVSLTTIVGLLSDVASDIARITEGY